MKRHYLLSMQSILLLALVFDSIYALVLSTTPPYFLLTVGLHLIIFGPLNYLGSIAIYAPISRYIATQKQPEGAKKGTETLAFKSAAWVFCLGLLYQLLFFALAPLVPQEGIQYSIEAIPPILFLSFVPPLIYVNSVLPSYIAYFIAFDFSLNLKMALHRQFNFVFSPGKRKIGGTLAIAFITIGFIPSMLTLLSLAGVTLLGDEYAKFTKINPLIAAFPDRLVGIAGMIFAVVFITRSLTHPIHHLLFHINEVKAGDYSTEAAITTSNEIGVLTQEFNAMVRGLKEREIIRNTFGKYVTKDIASFILEEKIKLGGELRQATILITDIANYTTLSEQMGPGAIVQMLNEYFSALVEVIQRNHGIVNKFIGDSIFAFFNVPMDDPKHAEHAIKAALEIEELTSTRMFGQHAEQRLLLSTRIGINSGQVLAGNLGSSDRVEYTVIGDEVNIAARLESLNKEYGTHILIGENTYNLAKEQFSMSELGFYQLRGRKTPTKIYTVHKDKTALSKAV